LTDKITTDGKKKVKCWEVFNCNIKECPAYKSKDLSCWLFSGTHCRDEIQGKSLEKMEMCLSCAVFNTNADVASMKAALKLIDRQFKEFNKIINERDRELEGMSMELALSLSEVFEALKKIASGDPTERIDEASSIELIRKLKHMVNLTSREINAIVDQSHEFAIGLAEHFDVLHRVSKGDLGARISAGSQDELLKVLGTVTNEMIKSISTEIDERKKAEEELEKLQHHNELILNSAAEGILGLDLQGQHTFVNSAAAGMLGYEVEELIGKHSHTIWHHSKANGSIYPEEECPIYATLKDGVAHHNIRDEVFWRRDGTSFYVAYSTTPIIDKGKIVGIVVSFRDITERKQMEEKLRALSLVDELTGLYNRRGFITLAEQQLKLSARMKRELVMLFTDLDNLKWINDKLGHKEGDKAIVDIANILKNVFRGSDIVARVGGDEFAVLAIEPCAAFNAVLTKRLGENIEAHNAKAGRPYNLSLSIGTSCYDPNDPLTLDELISQADSMMYGHKRMRKGIRSLP
jgi:diguanylate cyclase (GGDEF)-like protein/PAS domain S-box-containing protein